MVISRRQHSGDELPSVRCGAILDRDENAARNIAARGLRFSPNGPPGEAMVAEREPENATLILKVDEGKLSQQPEAATTHTTKT